MALITVKARIASTHPVPKYPGWQLSREALEGLAERLRVGDIPMLFDHDARETIAARLLSANVVALGEGHWALEATFEVDADAWSRIQDRFDAAGVQGGFSFTATQVQVTPRPGEEAAVILAADAAAWTDLERSAAGALLDEVAPTRIDRLFQYSGIEIATILLILGNVALGVLGNAVYDAVKSLMSGRTSLTRIEIHRPGPGGAVSKAIVTTDDPEIAREALETLASEQPAETVHFDPKKRLWLDH